MHVPGPKPQASPRPQEINPTRISVTRIAISNTRAMLQDSLCVCHLTLARSCPKGNSASCPTLDVTGCSCVAFVDTLQTSIRLNHEEFKFDDHWLRICVIQSIPYLLDIALRQCNKLIFGCKIQVWSSQHILDSFNYSK